MKRQFGGLLNLFKTPTNPGLQLPNLNGKIPPRGSYTKMEPLEPDTPVNNNTYGPFNLPGVTVTAPNLNKPQQFPYGQINVEVNNGRTLAYPSGNSPLQEAVFKNKAKRQLAGNRGRLFQAGGAFNNLFLNDGKFNILTAQGGDKLPKLNEWKFRRTTNNLNNGYSVISDLIMLTVENGYKTYDNPPISSGRTIYVTPNGNDTIFYRNKDVFDHNPQGDKNLKAAKSYFYKMIKLAPTEHSEYKGTKYWSNNDAQIDAARNRAIKGFQGGGEVRVDNTRVQKPIPSIVNKNSHIGSYDGVPVRVNNNYPYNDKYLLEAPTRSIYSPHENIKINAKYPHVYGVELTSLLPQYLQVIDNNDTTYYVQGKDENYYPAVGLSTRPIFRENFNKKGRKAESSYFRSPISFINKLK